MLVGGVPLSTDGLVESCCMGEGNNLSLSFDFLTSSEFEMGSRKVVILVNISSQQRTCHFDKFMGSDELKHWTVLFQFYCLNVGVICLDLAMQTLL